MFSTSRAAVLKSEWWQEHVGKGNWKNCQRRALGFILVVICWRRILRHSRLWRCRLRRASTSGQKMLLMLWSRSVLAECKMTLKMKGETDGTAGRATAARRGVGRMHHLDCAIVVAATVVGRGRGPLVSAFEPAWKTQQSRPGVEEDWFDFNFEWNTPSTINEFIELELTDGGSKFPRGLRQQERLSFVNLEREKRMRDEWLVLDLCGNGHRDPDNVVRCTIWDFHIRWLQSAEGDRRECCVATSNETSSNTMPDIQDPNYCVASRWNRCDVQKRETCGRWWDWCGLRAQELLVLLVSSAVNPVCVKTWPSVVETAVWVEVMKSSLLWRLNRSCANSQIVHSREEVRWFHTDHDISCETQSLS